MDASSSLRSFCPATMDTMVSLDAFRNERSCKLSRGTVGSNGNVGWYSVLSPGWIPSHIIKYADSTTEMTKSKTIGQASIVLINK